MPTDSSTTILQRASSKPDLDALRNELNLVLAQAGAIRSRQEDARNTRLCEWDEQSADCRKHGPLAKPFDGAADTRPMLVDSIINERVALLVEALTGGEMQSLPLGLDGSENAAKITRLLRWLRDVQLQPDLAAEAELLANYQEGDDPGIGVLKIWWKRTAAMEMRRLSTEDIGRQLLALRGIQLPDDIRRITPALALQIDDIGDLLSNPLREAEALDTLADAFPTVSKRSILRRALRGLRRHGFAELPLPYARENRLAMKALRFMDDIFFPSDVDKIQDARVIYEREFLSEAELHIRAAAEGWDAVFVESVIEKGPGYGDLTPYSRSIDPIFPGNEREVDSLYELWWAYSRATDDHGIESIYLTLFSDRVTDSHGLHELLDYPDGEYPFVLFRREHIGRGVQISRGIPRIAGSAQYQLKIQDDCLSDHTQLSTLPPLKVSKRIGGLSTVLGPMAEISVRDPNEIQWMQPPPFPALSPQVKQSARGSVSEYFGRLAADVPPELRQSILQHLVNKWLGNWVTAWDKGLKLMQDFMDPVETSLIAGSRMQKLTRDEIRGSFRAVLKFNVNDLNLEFVMKRLNAIAQLVQYDTAGSIDRNVVISLGMRAIDPALADMALRDTGVATDADRRDEMQALALMAQGVEPELQQDGANAQLRLQTLQQSLQKSPPLMRRLQQPQNQDDQFFAELVKNRIKNLQFLVQQYQENPMIGRTGTRPVSQ